MNMLAMLNQLAAQAPENIWDITVGPYTDLIGDFFWAVLLFIGATLVYLKTQSFGPTFLILIIGGLVLAVYIPGTVTTLMIFGIAIGVAYTFYRLFVRGKP